MRRIGISAGLLVGLALLMAWSAGWFNDRVAPQTLPSGSAPQGEWLTLEPTWVDRFETVPATLVAREATRVAARVLGRVVSVGVRSGDRVEAGALLVQLDDREWQARLAQAQQQVQAVSAQRDEADRDLLRLQALLQRGTVSQASVDSATSRALALQAQQQQARQAVVEAQTALSYTRIQAPISGRVVERRVEPGDTVAPGQVLLELYDPQTLQLAADVREGLALGLILGQSLPAQIDAIGEQVSVRLEERVAGADPGARTIRIKAGLPAHLDLLPGLYARLQLPAGREQLLLVPEQAIRWAGQLSWVTVRGQAGQSERRLVRTGRLVGDRRVVASGLQAGEAILLSVVNDAP